MINSSIQVLIVSTTFHYSEAATRLFYENRRSQKFHKIYLRPDSIRPRPATLLKKEAPVFSSEFCEIIGNTHFEEHLQTAASEYLETSQ